MNQPHAFIHDPLNANTCLLCHHCKADHPEGKIVEATCQRCGCNTTSPVCGYCGLVRDGSMVPPQIPTTIGQRIADLRWMIDNCRPCGGMGLARVSQYGAEGWRDAGPCPSCTGLRSELAVSGAGN